VETNWAEGNYSADYVGESSAMKGIWAMLDEVMNTYAVDGTRIYVMGLSMGGIGTWDLIMRHPGFFAAAAPVCGAADPSYASYLVDMPICTVHGDADGSVPTAGTRAMVAAIRDAGGEKIHYDELPGYGHNVWDYAASEATVEGMGLIEWLFSQSLEG
jgi:predicted peptidase